MNKFFVAIVVTVLSGLFSLPVFADKKNSIVFLPVPKISYGDFTFTATGRLHMDYAFFTDDVARHKNHSKYRRARLGAKGQFIKDLAYKLDLDFVDKEIVFKDTYINYTGIENVELRLGNFKPGLSLEDLTSSNDITFIERSAPTSAFVAGQILGAGLYTYGEGWAFATGAYLDNDASGDFGNEALYTSARVSVTPVKNEQTLLHLGGSFGYREPDQHTNSFDFDAKAENSVQAADSVSAKFSGADDAKIYGAEFLTIHGPFSAQAEYYHLDVDRSGINPDLNFDGGYAQFSWALTGESRPYNAKYGTMGSIVPDKPFSIAEKNWGAFELAMRYSALDLTDQNVIGGKMKTYTLGANWYLNQHARVMLNYIQADTDANAVVANDDPKIVLLRGQIDW